MVKLSDREAFDEDVDLMFFKDLFLKYVEKGNDPNTIIEHMKQIMFQKYARAIIFATVKYKYRALLKEYGVYFTSKEISSLTNFILGQLIMENETFKPNS